MDGKWPWLLAAEDVETRARATARWCRLQVGNPEQRIPRKILMDLKKFDSVKVSGVEDPPARVRVSW